MAFNLQAILRLDGSQFSNALNRITRATQRADRATGQWRDSQGRLRDSMGRFARAADNSSNSMSRFSRAVTSPLRGIGSLTTSIHGLVGAYAAAEAAKKAFESTIGEAAKYEQSSVMIGAMFNDKKLAKDYMNLVDSFSIDSPIMDSQSMLANSKSFITQTKDIKQLEKAWSLAERMAAIDPYQGVEGAVFALRELFSGDAISMVRRFEMPKQVMNEIKKMDLADQLVELDKYFNKIGMTQKLIDEMGGTTLGIWAQIKETANVVLRTMGQPALESIRKFLSGIRDGMTSVKEVVADRNLFTPEEFREKYNRAMAIERFKETGGRIIDNIVSGLLSSAHKIGAWFTSIQTNPDFIKQTTLFGQVDFVINDVYKRFIEWLDSGGRDKIIKTTADLIQIVIAGIEASIENITPVAVRLGSAIGQGVINGAKSAIADSWLARLIRDPVGFAINEGLNLTNKVTGRKSKWDILGYQTAIDNAKKGSKAPKRNGGVKYVPRDGAEYSLHRGEMILPRGEADNYRKGKSGGGVTISGNTFYLSGIDGNLEKAADQLMEILTSKIEAAGGAGA